MKINQPTNNCLDYQRTNFAALLQEGISFVNSTTPTRLDTQDGCIAFAKLFAEKLEELCIPHKIYNFKLCENPKHLHIGICIDNTLFIDHEGIFNDVAANVQKVLISKEELDKYAENTEEEVVFDKDCIPFMKLRIDEMFMNLGDYKVGSLKCPEQTQLSKKTIENIKKLKEKKKEMFNEFMKNFKL